MTITDLPINADVTYRANIAGGREAQIRLVIDPAMATVADAWARLSEAYAGVDPRTLEVEIRYAR